MWNMGITVAAFALACGTAFIMGILAIIFLASFFAGAPEKVPFFSICGPLAFAFLGGFLVTMMLTARDEVTPLAQVCAQVAIIAQSPNWALAHGRTEIDEMRAQCRAGLGRSSPVE
jgi:hypothetical protein